jgi:hypothetical protein
MKRRFLTVAALTPVGVLGVSGLALAVWTVASTGATGSAAAGTLGAPATVSTSNVSSSSVTINVTAGPGSGPTPTGYTVDRTAPSSATGICTISGSSGSCVDSSPSSGQTNTYAIHSLLGSSWVSGTAAATSASVPAPDATAPSTTATPTPTPNGAGWNNTNVSVALAATDNSGGSGVKQITYSATGAQLIGSTIVSGASTSVSITTEGTTTISYFATDNANNVETTKTVTVNLDKTGPTIPAAVVADTTANKAGFLHQAGSYRVYANVGDARSGVTSVTADVSALSSSSPVTLTSCTTACVIDGVTYGFKSAALTARSPLSGTPPFSVSASDAAGNTTTTSGLTATADNSGPTISTITSSNKNGIVAAGDTLVVTFSENIAPATVNTTAGAATLTFSQSGNGNVMVTIAGLMAISDTGLGKGSWVQNGKTVTCAGTLSSSGAAVTWTATASCTPSGDVAAGATGTLTYNADSSATGIKDYAGNAPTGTKTYSATLF